MKSVLLCTDSIHTVNRLPAGDKRWSNTFSNNVFCSWIWAAWNIHILFMLTLGESEALNAFFGQFHDFQPANNLLWWIKAVTFNEYLQVPQTGAYSVEHRCLVPEGKENPSIRTVTTSLTKSLTQHLLARPLYVSRRRQQDEWMIPVNTDISTRWINDPCKYGHFPPYRNFWFIHAKLSFGTLFNQHGQFASVQTIKVNITISTQRQLECSVELQSTRSAWTTRTVSTSKA